MKTVETKNAPAAIGPYSQAKICGGLVFASGQIPVNPASGNIECADVAGQTEQVCKNVAALLEFAAFNAVYEKYFTSRPARSCVAVKDIPKGALVEVECIAEI